MTPPELEPHLPDGVRAAAEAARSTGSASTRTCDLGVAFNKLVGYFRAFEAGDATSRDRRHLSRPVRQPGRRVPPPRVRVHDHRERARHPDALRAERGARVRRGVVPGARLAAHRSRRRRAAHGRHRRRQQDAAPPARRGSVRQAARVQEPVHAARGRHPRPDRPADCRRADALDQAAPQDDARSTAPITPRATGLPRINRTDVTDNRGRTALAVESVATAAFRGDAVLVSGHARAGLRGRRGGRCRFTWRRRGGRIGRVWSGETITRDDGAFALEVELPIDLEVGNHDVYAHTAGDDKRTPAVSE